MVGDKLYTEAVKRPLTRRISHVASENFYGTRNYGAWRSFDRHQDRKRVVQMAYHGIMMQYSDLEP